MQISLGTQWGLAAALLLYVAAMYLVGWFAQRRIHADEDFLVAGRRLPLHLAWLTLLATWFGAGTLLVAADEVRHEGLRAAALDPLGAGICLIICGSFIAAPMWRAKLLTVPDLFARSFGPRSEMLAALIMVPSYFGWIAVQFVALSQMLTLFFGLHPQVGILAVALVATGYTWMGGMWSVALTDAIQMWLVILGLAVLACAVLADLGQGSVSGGLVRLWWETPPAKRVVIPLESREAFWGWAGALASGALGNLVVQDLLQRVFAARSEQVARRACWIAGTGYLTIGLIPMGLGLAAALIFPDSQQALLPALASEFLHPALLVIFTLTLVSAVLSTVDSALLAPASILARNILSRYSRQSTLTLCRGSILLVALGSLALAYSGEDAYELLESSYQLTLVGLLVPMLGGLFFPPRHELPAVASMLLAMATYLCHTYWQQSIFLGFWPWFQAQAFPIELGATGVGLVVYLATGGWPVGRREPP